MRRVRLEIRRYRRVGPKLRALGWQEWKDLFRAQVQLARAQHDMKTRPTGDMVSDDPTPGGPATPARIDDARRIALAVSRAAQFGVFRPKCLVRSMALRRMLSDSGIGGAQVRVGVQVTHGRFVAHAWVEYGGQVVGDDPVAVSRYLPLTGIQVAELE
jgi:hypothetical protein